VISVSNILVLLSCVHGLPAAQRVAHQPPAKQARSASEAGRLDARVSTLP
jgi:hypothetical protein